MIRHPMKASALSISPGLACMVHSHAFPGVFCIYLVLIRMEEEGLRKAYGGNHTA